MLSTLIASIGYGFSSYLLLNKNKASGLFWACLFIALGAHAMQLFTGEFDMSNFPVMVVLSLIVFFMVLIGASFIIFNQDTVSCFVVTLVATICVWFPLLFTSSNNAKHGWEIKAHVAFSISSYIALAFAAIYACFLLIQDYRLRSGKDISQIPLALNYIERVMIQFALFGEILLGLSLVTGLLFIDDIWGQHISHKLVFSLIAWIIMGLLLFRHYKNGFRGRLAAMWLLCGFSFLILAYFGSAIVLQLILAN